MSHIHKTFRLFALILYAALVPSVSLANVANIQLENYSVEHGLSQSSVLDIVEDQEGFIWIATFEGLNRFDGYEFKHYFPQSQSSKKIQLEFVRELFVDSSGTLWISALNGVAKYIAERDQFQVYTSANSALESKTFWGIGETADGNVLLSGEKSLYTYSVKDDEFKKLAFENGEVLDDTVRTIFTESDKIWLGTDNSGIFVIDTKTNRLHRFDGNNPWGATIDAAQLYDIKIIDGEYWLGTERGALILSSDLTSSEWLNTERNDQLKIVNNTVRSIVTNGEDEIFLATYEGLSIYNKNSQSVFSVGQDTAKYIGLTNPVILTAFKDSKNSIWFGTHTSGLFQYHKQFSAIKHFKTLSGSSILGSDNTIWAFADNGDNTVWIPTLSGGLNLYYTQTGEFKRFLTDSNIHFWDIKVDQQKRVWVATDNGVLVYELVGDELRKVKTYLEDAQIVFITKMKETFWISAQSEEVSLYAIDSTDLSKPYQSMSFDGYDAVKPLMQDSRDNIWFNSEAGLVIADSTLTKYTNIQLRSNYQDIEPSVFDVHETDKAYWVSTGKHGIFELDKTTYQPVRQIHPRGDNARGFVVNSELDPISQDTVWQSSQSEIWQISLDSGELIYSIPRAVLDYNDLNQGSAIITNQGLALFGGIQGFHIFNPKVLSQLQSGYAQDSTSNQITLPAPTITDLKIHNKLIKVGDDNAILQKPIRMSDSVNLSNEDIPFTLEFGHINSLFAKQITYRYRLLGWRDTWFETDANARIAPFSIETYGAHTFEVQGKIGDAPWSDSARLNLYIAPPIWLDKPAMAAYGVMAVLMLLYILRQYKRKLAIQNSIKESEERLKLTLWSSGDELWDWDVYRGQVYRANTWGTIDFPQDDFRANSSYEANIHQNDIPRIQEALQHHIDKKSDFYQVTYRVKTFKGEWVWILDRGMIVKRDNNQQPLRMTGTLKNISHLKQAEEQLKLYERSIETISDGVFIADTNFRFISVNQSYCEYTGETREQGLASYLKFNQYPEAFTEEVKKALRQKGNWNGEVESRRVNGDRYEMELNIDAIAGEDGKTSHYVGVFSDISSRKSTEKELLKLANTDPLTEMPNRSFFQASHNNLVRKDVHHALVCLDMDNFKKINDSLGHQTGDILIKQIAKRLQKIAGTNATCYRLGGDEFSILVDNTEEMVRINHYAQRILDQMAHPFLINKQEFVLGASVGIAFYPEDGTSPQELLKNADTAMYFAKNSGGNKYQFFSGEMNQNAVRQLQIENLIRYGLKEDLFTVYYQPKIDIASGKLVSMEALVRFEHPEKGIVSPAQFIPLAEETGQIVEIGEQVLKKACEDTKRWVAKGLFTGRVAVNISARQFELPDLDDRISRILQKVGLSPLHLECEITEGTLMQNPEQALQMMQRLREKGIHLALDDFGTGYSSLAYLKQFPLNTLKIDKAFIDDIATSNVDKHMTAAIINIAHNLGLKVVAEGVEQERQLEILRLYECEMLQGYLYSKPLNATKFERLLAENLHINQLINAT
ncbi:EAL domain-containing protein [Aliiglaciecola sp. M165]|uniref:EAL domain-containing protein n=1 Tax=Aliiglaciecola sp. M165 TaxID=2593649 RepID=UPI00117E5D35|nr:EAL domain-containing protein [Aliiglaciecola sp. M165]TRY30990.1 EAL domain-containing protein [Aliiglaciecola sp. M165]